MKSPTRIGNFVLDKSQLVHAELIFYQGNASILFTFTDRNNSRVVSKEYEQANSSKPEVEGLLNNKQLIKVFDSLSPIEHSSVGVKASSLEDN